MTVPDQTSTTLTATPTASTDYRAVFTNCLGTATTTAATVTVAAKEPTPTPSPTAPGDPADPAGDANDGDPLAETGVQPAMLVLAAFVLTASGAALLAARRRLHA